MNKSCVIELSPREVAEPTCPGEIYSVPLACGQQLGVSVYNRGTDNRTVINFMPWTEHVGRPDATKRHQVMAETLGATLATVDNPGVGPLSTYLRREERAMLRHGELMDLMGEQYLALMRSRIDTLGKISLVGYSLGTVMATAFAEGMPEAATVDNIVLIEPVGVKPRGVVPLSLDFLQDGMRDRAYREENPDWFKQLPQTAPPQRAALADYVMMMSRGDAFTRLPDTKVGQMANITVVSNENSRVATPNGTAQLADYLGADHLVLEGENHSMLNSLGRVAALFDLLRAEERL